ncbi:MAG: NUDIX hydrolase [Alphaproteobacteria bacterium]|nr:MAG: NUDIX hydrolase [Alphaproteobacteria bacterium]
MNKRSRSWSGSLISPGLIARGYRLAFLLLRGWWWLRRPTTRGAVVALWHGPRLLVVQTSYRRTLSLPGGGLNRGESPLDGAVREVWEEIGLRLAPEHLVLARQWQLRVEHRQDHVWLYEVDLSEQPPLTLDGREIIAAEWVEPESLPPERLPKFLQRYLAERRLPALS